MSVALKQNTAGIILLLVIVGQIFFAGTIRLAAAQSNSNAGEEQQLDVYGSWEVGPITQASENNDLVIAKREAIAEARLQSFQILLHRFVPGDQIPQVALPEANVLASFERSRQIQNEEFGGTRYQADFSFGFLPDAVISYLRGNRVEFLIDKFDSILLVGDSVGVPQENGKSLWQSVLEFENARMFYGNPIIIAQQFDKELITRLRLRDAALYRTLTERYQVDVVMLARIELAPDASRLQLIHNARPELEVLNFRLPPLQQQNLFAELLGIRSRFELFWRNEWFARERSAPEPEVSNSVTVQFNFTQLNEFQSLQQQLKNDPIIEAINLVKINPQRAIFTLAFSGDGKALVTALAAMGFELFLTEASPSSNPLYQIPANTVTAIPAGKVRIWQLRSRS